MRVTERSSRRAVMPFCFRQRRPLARHAVGCLTGHAMSDWITTIASTTTTTTTPRLLTQATFRRPFMIPAVNPRRRRRPLHRRFLHCSLNRTYVAGHLHLYRKKTANIIPSFDNLLHSLFHLVFTARVLYY